MERNSNRAEAIAYCKKWTEFSISEAMRKGLNSTCLSTTSHQINGINYDVKDEIKEWLYSYGYKIRPTGYIGGVLQTTEDVYW